MIGAHRELIIETLRLHRMYRQVLKMGPKGWMVYDYSWCTTCGPEARMTSTEDILEHQADKVVEALTKDGWGSLNV